METCVHRGSHGRALWQTVVIIDYTAHYLQKDKGKHTRE